MEPEERARPGRSISEQPVSLSGPFVVPSTLLPALQQRLSRRAAYIEAGLTPEALTQALASSEWEIRAAALKGIGTQASPGALSLLRTGLSDEHVLVRAAAVRALGMLEGSLPLVLLARSLDDEDWQVREIAVLTLGNLDEVQFRALPEATRLLENMLQDRDNSVRTAAAEALARNAPLILQRVQTDYETIIDENSMLQRNKNVLSESTQQNNGEKPDRGDSKMQEKPGLSEIQDSGSEIQTNAGQMGAISAPNRRRISRRALVAGIGVGVASLGTAASYALLTSRQSTPPGSSRIGTSVNTPAPTPALAGTPTGTEPAANGKLGSIVTTFNGQSLQVSDARWSRDGSLVASASDDKTVQVWRAADGKVVFVYRKHTNVVNSVDWSPDGQLLVSAGGLLSGNASVPDYSVHIWSMSAGLMRKLNGPRDYIRPVRWSPDGKYIAAASYDSRAYVWEAATGHLIATYTGHHSSLTGLAWSPDSKRIVTCASNLEVHIWEATTARLKLQYNGLSGGLALATVWSPDGKLIATSAGGIGAAVVNVWNATTGNTLFIYQGHNRTAWNGGSAGGSALSASLPLSPILQASSSGAGVFSVAWSPDSQTVASGGGGGDGTVQLWKPATHQTLYTFSSSDGGAPVLSLAWSPGGAHIASVAFSTTTIWQSIA